MTPRPRSRRRKRKGLFMTWAGDSLWRRFVAWLGQTAILVAAAALVYVITMNVLVPNMVDGMVEVFRNSTR